MSIPEENENDIGSAEKLHSRGIFFLYYLQILTFRIAASRVIAQFSSVKLANDAIDEEKDNKIKYLFRCSSSLRSR